MARALIDGRDDFGGIQTVTFCQQYFTDEQRDPTITEIRVIDTYWSDHCRHTTFNTGITGVQIDDDLVKAAFEKYLSMPKETRRGLLAQALSI